MLALKAPKKKAGCGGPAGNNTKSHKYYKPLIWLSTSKTKFFLPQFRRAAGKPANRVN